MPTLKVKLRHGDVLTIDTLTGSVMMNYLKHFLAGGFQAHLQSNPFLHAVFDFHPLTEAPERLSGLEKRLFRSPYSAVSKARTQSRSSQRAIKTDVYGGGEW